MSGSRLSGRRIDAVAIGTSAGGVEALSVLLPALPARLAASVFIVIHLPRDRPSMLAEVFANKCRLPVVEADDKLPVAPGSVYFAPPDYHLLIDVDADASITQFALSADEPVNFSRPAIDALFESAADRYGANLLGIVLTGGNQDGAAGLKAIAKAGGFTIAQNPQTARMPLMPESAIALQAPDLVLDLEGIAALLATLAVSPA
jgi:two-component system, chemotaxis family, protein-glutamate methylesterase/glutaminase